MTGRIACVICCFFSLLANAQKAINVTGKTLRTDSITYAYSVGEITAFQLNGSCLYTPGVIQPTKISVTPPDQKLFDNYHEALLYPNPTRAFIIIEPDDPGIATYQIASYDGKIVRTGKFLYAPINISGLQPGLYLISIFSADYKRKQTFKIIKL